MSGEPPVIQIIWKKSNIEASEVIHVVNQGLRFLWVFSFFFPEGLKKKKRTCMGVFLIKCPSLALVFIFLWQPLIRSQCIIPLTLSLNALEGASAWTRAAEKAALFRRLFSYFFSKFIPLSAARLKGAKGEPVKSLSENLMWVFKGKPKSFFLLWGCSGGRWGGGGGKFKLNKSTKPAQLAELLAEDNI